MKRKVVRHGSNTLTVSLPAKWCRKFNVKSGIELDISERGNELMLSTEKEPVTDKAEIDVSELDRTSIILYIRSFYRLGYDEVRVLFKNQLTHHFRIEEKVKVISIIHEEVNRLIGFEIINQKEDSCTIKNLSADPIHDFDMILRKIFLQLDAMANDFLEGAKRNDYTLLETIEEKHDTLTKFVSYCLRLLNKRGYPDFKETIFLYYVINSLDMVVDVLKYSARDILRKITRLNKKTLFFIERICQSIALYSKLFYHSALSTASEILKTRDKLIKDLYALSIKMPKEDLLLITKLEQILEIIKEIVGYRMGLMSMGSKSVNKGAYRV